jgi:hypothetical protein
VANQFDPNNWYDRHGVDRPRHDPHLTEEELLKTFEKIRAETVHGDWIQEGNRLTCRRCNPPHSDTIPTDYLLQGTDKNGLPKLKKIDI